MTTYSPKVSEIKHFWHLIDANGQILGRLASEIATLLIGKNKPYFVPHLDCGDYVVVINAKEIKVTGKKETQKQYYRHSGYPGGFRQVNLKEQMAKDPRKIIEHAVAGMLPKNKLKDKRLVRLKIFIDEKHPYEDKVKS
ncbi:MAG: large subunit ribosomal protein L13 [Microgenomates group bacterium LiPW_31]|nr:MAG: large subunit ribosomal protein L13 [Microgenomates group bacterium LiPW_31]